MDKKEGTQYIYGIVHIYHKIPEAFLQVHVHGLITVPKKLVAMYTHVCSHIFTIWCQGRVRNILSGFLPTLRIRVTLTTPVRPLTELQQKLYECENEYVHVQVLRMFILLSETAQS